MKVILKKDVKGLGKLGDIVNTKTGYATNYLLPKGLAVEATDKNLKTIAIEKQKQEEKYKVDKKIAIDQKDILKNTTLLIETKNGPDGKLYGSVTSKDIHEKLLEKNIDIDKKKIMIKDHIKAVGTYEIKIKLFPEIETTVKLEIRGEES